MPLSNSKERVKLLKVGILGKCIEKRYLEETGTRIVDGNQYHPPRSVIDLLKNEI